MEGGRRWKGEGGGEAYRGRGRSRKRVEPPIINLIFFKIILVDPGAAQQSDGHNPGGQDRRLVHGGPCWVRACSCYQGNQHNCTY